MADMSQGCSLALNCGEGEGAVGVRRKTGCKKCSRAALFRPFFDSD